MSSQRIGMVGVGRMGSNMARRLKDQGFTIQAIYDVNRELATALALELGCAQSEALSDLAAQTDVIITVVTDDAAMRSIFRADQLLKSGAGKLFINCATISPAVHLEVEAAVQKAGGEALEACMASSITQARDGTLFLMCGGSRGTFDKALPVLKALSQAPRFIGPTGTAAQVKALVNMVMNINTAGLAEGLGLGHALGLDLDMLRGIFSVTGAGSRVLQTDGEDMQKRDHDCFFSAAHAAKDSGIALELGREAGLKLPLAEATLRQYERLVELGLGELDKSGVAELTFKDRRG